MSILFLLIVIMLVKGQWSISGGAGSIINLKYHELFTIDHSPFTT
ncbi:hypothetical protein [Niastella vici]|nr:hypothetical protein [Niastella vici]